MRQPTDRKRIVIIFGLSLLFVLFLFIVINKALRPQSDTGSSGGTTVTQVNTAYPELSQVNPEERNILLKKAGLPYEIDQYAITYQPDTNAPFGVVLIVIDKVSPSGVSTNISGAANQYLLARDVDLGSIRIEYRNAKDAL